MPATCPTGCLSPLPAAWWGAPLVEGGVGGGVALAELARQGVLPSLLAPTAGDPQMPHQPQPQSPPQPQPQRQQRQLDYTPAQAEQMRPLYEVSAAEPSFPRAATAIVAWQLAVALAEELYYRGFVESAGVLAISYPLRAAGVDIAAAGALPLVEGLPLLVSAALFGLVHAEFVEGAAAAAHADDAAGAGAAGAAGAVEAVEAEAVEAVEAVEAEAAGAADAAPAPPISASGVRDTKAFWFRATAAYGALYSSLYVLSGHRLLAPVCAHAGLNIGLCLRDWGRMRRTPPALLRRVFSAREGTSSGQGVEAAER